MSRVKVLAATLTLSATGFLAIMVDENYTEKAVIPTKNDRPTLGFGSTFHEDGSAVKLGDTTTPVKALIKAKAHIDSKEKIFRKSIADVKVAQEEYDLYLDWTYQYGTGRWLSSSMLRNLKAGDYVAACNSILLYKYSGGYDCSIPGNKICAGVWTRNLKRNSACLSYQ